MQYTNKSVRVFFAIVIVASIIVEGLIILGGPDRLYLLMMWIPAVSAIIAVPKNKGVLGRLGIRKCKIRYILQGILFPFIYLLVPYIVYWITHPSNFAYNGVSPLVIARDLALPLISGIFVNLISAAGEEIGWRGFMFPSLLQRIGLRKTLFASGLIWALWHVPVLVAGGYMTGAPVWYKIPAFILCIVPVGIISGVLAYRSKSIWPSTFLHAAHNHFDQGIFGILTAGEDKMFYVSETGLITIVCAWIIATLLLASASGETA
ncbi:CAAX protease self-immunity [Oscillospiraceae bacterium]|nr:CAAX protease self-immunity [Oscillospiraceae bacterium]